MLKLFSASQIGGKEDDNKGLGVGKISGIAIGAAVGIVLLVLIILLFAVKLRKQMKIKIFVTARPQQNIQGIGMCYYFIVNNVTIPIIIMDIDRGLEVLNRGI